MRQKDTGVQVYHKTAIGNAVFATEPCTPKLITTTVNHPVVAIHTL